MKWHDKICVVRKGLRWLPVDHVLKGRKMRKEGPAEATEIWRLVQVGQDGQSEDGDR